MRVPGGPDAGTVDAAPPAVEKHAVHHDVEVLLPAVHHIVTQQNLAEAWPVDLNARVAFVSHHGRGPPEDHAAAGAPDHFGAYISAARVDGDRLPRHARPEERSRHAIGSPRLLRARF